MVAAKLIDVTLEGRQLIDRFELVAEIASGGMATVFLARLSGVGGFQKFVAIKRLHPHLANEREFVEMFLDEARLAAGIHHPNVVSILEVGASDRGYYLVMEYIEGDTLARLLARAATTGARLPRPVALRIVLDTLLGLHAAHELRDDKDLPTELVHRDVSPQNVLVGLDGICRITDFGVARAAQRLTATRVGQLKGKIAYMAPEQAQGQADIDRRADVFACGIVLWEVLAGRRLFKSENEAATLSRVLNEPIPDVREAMPDVPELIANVVARALERSRDARFASTLEFAEALELAAQLCQDKICSPRELATYVSEVIGNDIAQQRDAVRAWLARSEPSQIQLPDPPSLRGVPVDRSGVTSVVGTGPHSQLTPPPRRTGLWLFGFVLAVGAVGLGAWWVGRASGGAGASADAPPSAAAPPSALPQVPTTAEATPSAELIPAAPASAEPEVAPTATSKARPTATTRPTSKPRDDDLPSNPYR
ncbi:MAG: serine/threonine protein kinase [Polyangiaceae bacterium]|nr:serine/threonine protein kinase [Polyangiaceae bacterium]